MTLQERISNNGQKKLLALDGGGIRGVITLEILANIERLLRERDENANLVLADYFDYIAGTSTGAIIATCVSLGMTVEAIREFYVSQGRAMFQKARFFEQVKHRYVAANLTA